MLEKSQLWRHTTHQSSRDYAILGVSALVGDHERPRGLFLDCLAVYVQSGLAENVNRQLRETVAHAWANPEELIAQQTIYQSLVCENLMQIRRDPFVGIEIFVDAHLEPTRDAWAAIMAEGGDHPELDATISKLAAIPALGGSQAAINAISTLVGLSVNTPETIFTYKGFERSPLIQALSAFTFGNDAAKASSRKGRALTVYLRRLAEQSQYRKLHADKLSRAGHQWAAVWETFDGRCLRAAQSGLPIFDALTSSQKITDVCLPFNKSFGVSFPRGRERMLEDVILPRGHRIRPTDW